MHNRRTIVVVLKSSKDFTFRDVELIARHINGKWKSEIRPRIICLYDKATTSYDLGNIEIVPLKNNQPGTWARIQLYSPEMEQYKPFLYVDLDTIIVQSIEKIFDLVTDESKFITLEDFWQAGKLATGLVWFPANCEGIRTVWNSFRTPSGNRMDNFLRKVVKADIFWQKLSNTIQDFKPRKTSGIQVIPANAVLLCLHGKPRIHDAVNIPWVKTYVEAVFSPFKVLRRVTVIIPYNKDRGWLQDAINSVPKDCQLLLSKGDGHWGQNFNKVLPQATGDYIRWLHEDDMLTENSIQDAVDAIESQGVDFIHGNATELHMNSGISKTYRPPKINVTLKDLLVRNTIHSATLMYKKEVFEKIGGFDESKEAFTLEEYEFNLRCLKAGLKLGYCDSLLAIYRRHNTQLVRTLDKREKQRNKANYIKKYAV